MGLSVTNGQAKVTDMRAVNQRGEDQLVQHCLASIRAISPGIKVQYTPLGAAGDTGHDGELRLGLSGRQPGARYLVSEKRTHLSYALVDGLLGGIRRAKAPCVIFAPHVAPHMGRYLAEKKVSYVDAVGNLHLTADDGRTLIAHVEGRSPRRAASSRGMRLPAHLVTFALLGDRESLAAPVRTLAAKTGVSKTAVADQLQRLTEQGFLVRTKEGLQLLRPGSLLDRWISAYLDTVRPRWLVGRFQTQEADVEKLEHALPPRLTGLTWAFGGGAAAWRLTRYYRGEETILHVASAPPDLPGRLRALPSASGNLVVLTSSMPLAFKGSVPHVVHSLLIYSELLASLDPRARESAEDFRRQHLPELT